MSEKLKGIVKLSEERYWEMYNAGTLDPYKQYETPQEPTYSQAQIDKKLNKLEEEIQDSGGTVDAYTKTETNALLEDKADKDSTYTKNEVDEIKQDLQDQITTATGGEYSKVLVGGEYQPSFDADTKANASDLQATNTQVSSLDQTLDSLVLQIADEIADRKNADTEINNILLAKADRSEIPSIEGLASETFVNNAVSDKATTGYVDEKVADLIDSAPETLNTLGELAQAIKDNESIVDALNSAIGNKANLSDLNTTNANVEQNASDIKSLQSNKADISAIPTKTSDLTNDSGFITEEDIPAIPTKTSQLANDSGFLTEVPSEYVTETELNNKGYLTSYTETDPTVPAWAKEKTKPTYTYNEITEKPTLFSGSYNDLSDKPNIPSIEGLAKQSDLDTTNSKVQENANAISDINSSLSSKADKAALDTVSNNVTTIQGKIPTQASATNQLADKEFVNSSISTATATFRGTVNSVDSLPTTGVDINDYAFVRATDSAGNTLYQRYKYNGSAWAFEYELNNSSFTSEQWATINSGLTKDYVDSADLNTISAIIAEVENLLKDKADKSAIPTKVSQLDNDSGFISSYTETDPTVPDWAKQPEKPEYDFSEIKNTPTIPETSSFATKNELSAETADRTNAISNLQTQINAKISQNASQYSSSGYVKLSNGLIIQWVNSLSASGSASGQTISLPTPFTNSSSYAVVPVMRGTSKWGNAGANGIQINTNNASSFVSYTYWTETTFKIMYIAIGY